MYCYQICILVRVHLCLLVLDAMVVGVLTPGAWHQLVMMLRVPNPRWLMQETIRGLTVYPGSGRGAVRPARGCARALYYLAPEVPVVGGTSEAREGGKLPSLC